VKKISTRFAILMAVVAIVPLLAFGAASGYFLSTGTRETVVLGLDNVAQRAASQIELYVFDSIRILQGLAANLDDTDLQPYQQERLLRNYALKFREFNELTLTDEHGDAIVTSRLDHATLTIPGQDDEEVIPGVVMSPFSIDDALLPEMVLSVKIEDRRHTRWLVARVRLEALWEMVDGIKVGSHGFALVATKGGDLIAHGEPEAKPLVATSKDERPYNIQGHPLMAPALTGRSAQYPSWPAERKGRGELLGVKAQVPGLRWIVIVEQPVSEAFDVPLQMRKLLIVAITVALFVMLTVGYFFGRRFINPILRLTRGTRALAEGHLEERVVVDSRDELGQLGTAFNNMADKLVELQEDVRKKERQAMFGRVSIGLVHDLSTPIQNIGNACKMITMLFDDLEYRETFKRTCDRELTQIKRMLEDLRNVAKPVPLEKFPLDLNKVIADAVESMKTSAESSGLTLEAALAFGPLYIDGDRYALTRVYGNLIKNAFQATAPKGKVLVRTVRQDAQAVVEVTDTGAGIPADRLATIFDDFVTTKKRGLGLGLAISKKIVEQLGGTIAVASEVGRGTTFTLRFPLTTARPEQLAS
jgi:signal transduction histidine kinase